MHTPQARSMSHLPLSWFLRPSPSRPSPSPLLRLLTGSRGLLLREVEAAGHQEPAFEDENAMRETQQRHNVNRETYKEKMKIKKNTPGLTLRHRPCSKCLPRIGLRKDPRSETDSVNSGVAHCCRLQGTRNPAAQTAHVFHLTCSCSEATEATACHRQPTV